MSVLNVQKLIEDRVQSIRHYHRRFGIKRAELDVSGGVDSAVMLMLLAVALGPENITAVYSSINSSPASRERAQAVATAAGVKLIDLDLSKAFNLIGCEVARALEVAGYDGQELSERDANDRTIAGSFRSCLRAPVGRYLNRLTGGGVRHGTGNEDEDRWLRFYQKGGDGEVDTNPIAMLSKGETFQLGIALRVPREIIMALPSPDLWGCGDQHNDEEELAKLSGVEWTYSRVDPESGKYLRVGTIERMNRCLDSKHSFLGKDFSSISVVSMLFGETDYLNLPSDGDKWRQRMLDAARPFFHEFEDETIAKFLASARRWEAMTRHKMNPNCPALGHREELVKNGILTDELPEV